MPSLKLVNDKNPREIAARILGQRKINGEFTENLLERELATAKLSTPDRGLCQEIVYGCVRRQMTLDWLISKKTNAREQKFALQNILRLGLYQIFWLDKIPPHAAVHEAVELAKRSGYGSQSGFVNAILRGYLREFDATKKILGDLKISNPAIGYSHPQWLVQKWQKRFGNENAAQLLDWNNSPPKTFARVNTLKTDAGNLLEKWREEDVEYDFVRSDWLPENLIFELKAHPSLGSLDSFRDGWFYIQDPSTLLAALELKPQSGETILDLCAAPGGKTTFIAQTMNNDGKIVATDISEDRLKLIQENCERLGVNCVELRRFSPHPGPLPSGEGESQSARIQKDDNGWTDDQTENGAKAVPSPRGEGQGEGKRDSHFFAFDKILIDAPCSNSGVMRRRVDLRWRISSEEILRLRQTQLDLLKLAATKLKSGGVLVYSTCSLESEENAEVIAEFLREQKNFQLESQRELLPFTDNFDGAFVVRLKKI